MLVVMAAEHEAEHTLSQISEDWLLRVKTTPELSAESVLQQAQEALNAIARALFDPLTLDFAISYAHPLRRVLRDLCSLTWVAADRFLARFVRFAKRTGVVFKALGSGMGSAILGEGFAAVRTH